MVEVVVKVLINGIQRFRESLNIPGEVVNWMIDCCSYLV